MVIIVMIIVMIIIMSDRKSGDMLSGKVTGFSTMRWMREMREFV